MVGSGDRSEKIRTYNFPQNRVTDHRIGLTLHQLDLIMEGRLDPLIHRAHQLLSEREVGRSGRGGLAVVAHALVRAASRLIATPKGSMTIQTALLQGTSLLEDAAIAVPRLTAEVLLAHALQHDRAYLYAHSDEELSERRLDSLRPLPARAAKGKPTQYITGRQEFYGREFRVTPDVLIPRPETEHLVEASSRTHPPGDTVLDVGTGSGAIAVTLALETGARVLATDISLPALCVAAANARKLIAHVTFLACDLAACFAGRSHQRPGLEPALRARRPIKPASSAKSATRNPTWRCSAARPDLKLRAPHRRSRARAAAGRLAAAGTRLQFVRAGASNAQALAGARSKCARIWRDCPACSPRNGRPRRFDPI